MNSNVINVKKLSGLFGRAWMYILCSIAVLGITKDARAADSEFHVFEELASKDFGKDKGSISYHFDDCKLFAISLDTPGKSVARLSYLGPRGLGGIRLVAFDNYPVPSPDLFFYPRLGFSFTLIDLRGVERISQFVGGQDVEVVMDRGKNLFQSNASVSFEFSSVSYGQSKTLDEARVDALFHIAEVDGLFQFGLPPVLGNAENWEKLTASEAGFREVLFVSGTLPPTFANIKLNFSAERSQKLGIADGWPEDAKKIHEAFAVLVDACQ